MFYYIKNYFKKPTFQSFKTHVTPQDEINGPDFFFNPYYHYSVSN